VLRPMANIFAVTDADPAVLDRIEGRVRAGDDFERVYRPTEGWIAAYASLPESEPDRDDACSRGFLFLEGRDRLERLGADWLDRLSDLCDLSPTQLDELPGDFGFIHFRPDGTALAVRACAGRVPLYLHRREGGGLAIGTLLNYFPRLLPTRFHPDRLINAAWARTTTTTFIQGRTFVRGVSVLPRATATEVAAGRALRTRVYWDPRPQVGEKVEPDPAHARELRSILITNLERDLDPSGRSLLMLSGGVDSSALGALIAGVLGRPLSSWSMIPAREPGRSGELSYIDPLVQSFGIEPADKRELTEELHRRWIMHAPGLPFQILHPALCDLPAVCAEREVRSLVSGMFADEICGDRQRLTDWVLHTSMKSLATGVTLPFGGRDYLRWVRRRLQEAARRPRIPRMELDVWVPDEVVAEHQAWLATHQASLARDRRPLRELATRADADAWVAMYWEGASPLGVRPVLPFFNREVLELAYRCHPQELLGPGKKRLLVDALRDDVPARNLLRPDRGLWTGHERGVRWRLDGPLPAAAEAVVRREWLSQPPPDVPFMDGTRLASAIRVAEYLEVGSASSKDGVVPLARGQTSM